MSKKRKALRKEARSIRKEARALRKEVRALSIAIDECFQMVFDFWEEGVEEDEAREPLFTMEFNPTSSPSFTDLVGQVGLYRDQNEALQRLLRDS